MKEVIFAITSVVNLVILATVVQSWLWPARRVWPPPGRDSWQFWWTWTLVGLLCSGILLLAILDWNTFVFPHWSRFIPGGGLFTLGNALAWWGVAVLSLSSTAGLSGDLVTSGPYRFSRNPQYLGDIAILIGVGLLTNSLLVSLAVLPAVISCIIVPLAEEPWLAEQYGEQYERYKQSVRRFL